jgi:hypothetical protein
MVNSKTIKICEKCGWVILDDKYCVTDEITKLVYHDACYEDTKRKLKNELGDLEL